MNILLFLLLLLCMPAWCQEQLLDEIIPMGSALAPPENNVIVDLCNPAFYDGVLTTEQGGIISAPDLRVQAMHIAYTNKTIEKIPTCSVVAEGELIIEFNEYNFVGDRLEYDFINHCGVIHNGRTMIEPWFFGGKSIFLLADGSYVIHYAYATTSPNINPDWIIASEVAKISDSHNLWARNVQFKIFDFPVFWIPSFRENLDSIFDFPVRFSAKWGSRQGHRLGVAYEVFSWNNFKTLLRLDYRLKRGFGGGLETSYRSPDRKTNFQSISYAARDSSIIHPSQRFRYLFQGVGDTLLMDDKVSVHLSYDKISDIDMPTDYYDCGLDLETAGPTELLIHRQEDMWMANLNTRVRVNPFQTIKQELPTFEATIHPFNLGPTGIVVDTFFKASYLDLVYGNNQLFDHDYSSTRIEMSPVLYRNFRLGQVNVTPDAGCVGIIYGNAPRSSVKYLAMGKFGLSSNTDFHRYIYDCKHVITPYINYNFYTAPTVSPNQHYIFDIEDGWYRLNLMRFGISQSLYRKLDNGCIIRPLYADIFTNTFFDTDTFPQAIPKVYANFVVNSFSFLKHTLFTCWNFNQNELDFFNARTEWTINADAAFAIEYRHRSPFDWRKADHTNFVLDSFRTVSQLRHSQVSDRRDTVLFHMFWRFHPCWAFQAESRHGWNREFEPAYNEFEVDLIGNLPSAWNFRLSYQHREDDDRVSVYMSIGLKRPNFLSDCQAPPLLSF